jgi:hypothetical protein
MDVFTFMHVKVAGHVPCPALNKAEEWSFLCCIPLSGCHAIIAYNGYGDILPASA